MGLIWRAQRNNKKLFVDAGKKLYSNDRDIKTLHFNQKVLYSSIKELRKDLKTYGEVKKSRTRQLLAEKDEAWPEQEV